MLDLCVCRQQRKKAMVGKSQNRFWFFVLILSSLFWFLLLYSYVWTSNGGNNGITLLANYANSIISRESYFHPVAGNSNATVSSDHEKKPVKEEVSTRRHRVEQVNPLPTVENGTELVTKQAITGKGEKMKSKFDSCLGRYIYIHNLPTQFNTDILNNCHSLIKWFDLCPYTMNLGFGPRLASSGGVLLDKGWFATNQFLLEVIFHNRMKQYKCLTNDSSLASAIFVPFYAGLDVGRFLWDFNTSVRDSASLHLVKWLAEKPEWKKLWGRDHFLITGRISWDFRRPTDNYSDWGNQLMFQPESKNMTILGIESRDTHGDMHSNEFAIPYPTYFHPSSERQVFQWQKRMRRQRRRYLFSFAGAPRPNMLNSVRGTIIDQCRASRKKCKLLECDPSANKCDNPVNVMEMFQNSIFCLQPPGDSYTRRSTFDSILAGCIPVFFHPASAYVQYEWHLPKDHTKYSVFIPESDVKDRKVSIKKILLGISKNEVLAMRKEVIRLIPRVMYADPMHRSEKIEDAFDIAVKGVLERVETIRTEIRE